MSIEPKDDLPKELEEAAELVHGVISNLIMTMLEPHYAAESKTKKPSQAVIDTLRGIHQALAHNMGMIEPLLLGRVPEEDRPLVEKLLKKEREDCHKDGREHAQMHLDSPDGTCNGCTDKKHMH